MPWKPDSRDWKAEAISQRILSDALIVSGRVQTSLGTTPRLREHAPGANPLILPLSLEGVGASGTQIYCLVNYGGPVPLGRYDAVDIMFDGQVLTRIRITQRAAAKAPRAAAKKTAPKPRASAKKTAEKAKTAKATRKKKRL